MQLNAGSAPRWVRLTSQQVSAGEPLPFDVLDEHGRLLLARGRVVAAGSAQWEALLERGLYADAAAVQALQAADAPPPPKTLFEQWAQALWQLQALYKRIDGREGGFPERFEPFVAALMALVRRDADVAIYLTLRQDERRLHLQGLTHALHAAVASQLLASRLGWADDRTTTLVRAALTMNVAVHALQGRAAAQGRLTERDREQLRAHPLQGVALLREAGVTDAAWLAAVRDHHERPDGSGYPAGVALADALPLALRTADAFIARISPRADRPALPVQAAARQVFEASGGSAFAAALIKEYGLYPPGDFVQLASGELAVVMRRGATATTPLAAAITNRAGVPVVSSHRRDTACPAHAIVGPAPDRRLLLRVPPERLFGLVS